MPAHETVIVTVAAVRKQRNAEFSEVWFHERQRIHRVPHSLKSAADSLKKLKRAQTKKEPVKVRLHIRSGSILNVAVLTPAEVAEFHEGRTFLENPDKVYDIDISSIDPTTFNIVGKYLKSKTFGLCNTIVPNYAKAKEFFDFCAAQSCHLSSPSTITPCIPFQYVIDGCYARAHKMRQIIEDKYGYCSEKIFSYANESPDILAARADKWGGCCVKWWWHVAPLIRVNVNKIWVVAMVVDPGLFDNPVFLSTWLTGQKNISCDSNADVSKYSIQPSAAYGPSNLNGTAYVTDPYYVSTNQTLVAFRNLITCRSKPRAGRRTI